MRTSRALDRAAGSAALPRPNGQPGRQTVLAIAVLSVATLLAYSNSFAGVFVFDDIAYLAEYPQVRWPWRILYPQPGEPWNRPFAYLTFALNYALHGENTWGYHAVNFVIHLSAGISLYLLIRRTLSHGSLANRWADAAQPLAFATALVWLVHPLLTQSVTYIYQRQESLMGLFYLLTLLGFAYGVDARSTAHRRGWWAVSVACCALGMATKEVMVTAPIMVVWYDRAFVSTSWRDLVTRHWRIHAALAGAWAVLAWMVYYASKHYVAAGVLTPQITSWEYARSQPGVILHYLRLCFWPRGQCLDYAWPVAQSWAEIVPASLVILTLLAATAWATIRQPALGFLGGWFFLILAPTSSIAPIIDLAFEHRMYLPLAAVALGTSLIVLVISRRLLDSEVWRRRFQIGTLTAAALALGTVTYCRNELYHSCLGMWQDVASKSPLNARAFQNMATRYMIAEDASRALVEARRSVELNPIWSRPRLILADALFALGRSDEALVELNTALKLESSLPDAYFSRGRLFVSRNELEPAVADFARAAEFHLHPLNLSQDWLECGLCRMLQQRPDQAVECFRKSIICLPDRVEVWHELGRAHWKRREYSEALQSFNRALELQPGMAICYLTRGTLYGEQGRHELASQDFSRAIELQPDLAGAYSNRAVAYYQLGDVKRCWADLMTYEQQTGERHPFRDRLEQRGLQPN